MADQTLSPLLRQAAELTRQCVGSDDPDVCERLQIALGDLDAAARESFQERLRDTYHLVARKLELGEPLSGSEREALDLLLTGAARHYLRSENDLEAWKAEISRVADELERMAAGEVAAGDLMKIQALCREALHVAAGLSFYLGEQARLRRYQASAEAIDPDEGKLLARVVRDMIASARR